MPIRAPAGSLRALRGSASFCDPGDAWSSLDCPADLPQAVCGNEEDAVIVGEHDVVTCDHVFAEASAREGTLRIESPRSARVVQLRRVAVHSPDDKRRDAGRCSSSTDGDSLTGDQSP
jgi:hypothetical protein